MKFKINNDTWYIKKVNKEKMRELWKQMTNEDRYVFGITCNTSQLIFINNDICKEQQIKTLKHELAHCYIWEYGFYYVEPDEETVCEIIAKSNDFINEIVKNFEKLKE